MQTNNFIKVANPNTAEKLKAAGFSTYMQEQMNGETVFVYAKTPELVGFLESHFARSDFFDSNRLHF